MTKTSFKKIIALNDCVGTLSDEISFLNQASTKALLSETGIRFKSKMSETVDGSIGFNFKSGNVFLVKQLHQFISKSFCVINIDQSGNSSAVKEMMSARPVLFSAEDIDLKFYYKNRLIKTITVAADSKRFHEKLHVTIATKSLFAYLFGEAKVDFDEEIVVSVSLSPSSYPIRTACSVLFDNYCKNLIVSYIKDNYWRYDGEFEYTKLCQLTFRPRSLVSLYQFLSNEYIIPSSSSNRVFDVDLTDGAVQKAFNNIESIREKIYAIEEGLFVE